MTFLQSTAKLYATIRGAKTPSKQDIKNASELVERINNKRISANLQPFE